MPSIVLHTEFPELIDNTMREAYSSCPTKFHKGHIQKIGPNPPSVHLHAGGAYAAGLEIMRKEFYDLGTDEETAKLRGIEALIQYYGDFECPAGSNKSLDRMIGALEFYTQTYPLATDIVKPFRLATGKHAIEFTFAIPMEVNHPVTGQPLLYSGRFDMLAIRDDALFVEDDKTTSQLGPTWGGQWDLNSQFTGYCYAAQTFGYPVAGAIIRGTSILKEKYGDAQAIVYRPQWQLDRWWEQLHDDAARMISDYNRGWFGHALGGACSHYSGCEFKRLCLSQNPDQWLDAYYTQRLWNPLDKDPEAETPIIVPPSKI